MRRRIAIVVFVVLVPVAGHAVWDYVESRRLFRAIDDMRQRGEPVSREALGEWVRPTADDEILAARYYNAAGELAFRDWLLPSPANANPEANALRRARADVEAAARDGEMTADAHERLQLLRTGYAEALEMADRAAALAFSRFPAHGFEDFPRTYSLEKLAAACSARTTLLAFASQGDEAAESLWSCVRLRRAHVRNASPVRWLLLELRLVLERTRPSAEVLGRLQLAFAEREQPDALERDIRERTALLIEATLAELYGPKGDPLVPAANVLWTWRPSMLNRPWLARRMTMALRQQQQILTVASRPWPGKLSAFDALSAEMPPLPERRPNERLDLRYYAKFLLSVNDASSAATGLTQMRAGQVAAAVARFRDEHGGQLPPTLDSLVPSYLQQIPQDPFSGAPLRFASSDRGFSVYGLGADRKDDGGDVDPLTGVKGLSTKDVGLMVRTQGGIR